VSRSAEGRFTGRARVGPDPFSDDARPRLRRLERDLDAVIADAQSRDWSADRPDRVVFARLGQARHHVRSATRRSGPSRPPDEPVVMMPGEPGAAVSGSPGAPLLADPAAFLLGAAAGCLAAGAALVIAGPAAARPLPSAVAAVAGLWAALIAVAVLRGLRRRWDRLATAGPAPVDDPYRYAAIRRRLEAGAVTARRDRSHRRRAAAVDLEYALDWLAAAQSELPRR
jgi:hypothetical protein